MPPAATRSASSPGTSGRSSELSSLPTARIISAGGDRYLRIWETATGKSVGTLLGHRGLVEALAISPDGKRLASGGVENEVMTWDLASQTPLTNFEFRHTNTVSSVAFRPDGLTLAPGSRYACGRPTSTKTASIGDSARS